MSSILSVKKGEFMNLFIPNVPNHLITTPDERPFGVVVRDIVELLEDRLGLGRIIWVNFDNHGNEWSRSAHVRFSHWYDTDMAKTVRNNILTTGYHLCVGYHSGETFVTLTHSACISLYASSPPERKIHWYDKMQERIRINSAPLVTPIPARRVHWCDEQQERVQTNYTIPCKFYRHQEPMHTNSESPIPERKIHWYDELQESIRRNSAPIVIPIPSDM